MSSFTRTVPTGKTIEEVQQFLEDEKRFVPLTFLPGKGKPGDSIYLVYRGAIIARARIAAIEPAGADAPDWARWVVRCAGAWEVPPRRIPLQGHQGVRYLENQGLEALDLEDWQAFPEEGKEK